MLKCYLTNTSEYNRMLELAAEVDKRVQWRRIPYTGANPQEPLNSISCRPQQRLSDASLVGVGLVDSQKNLQASGRVANLQDGLAIVGPRLREA